MTKDLNIHIKLTNLIYSKLLVGQLLPFVSAEVVVAAVGMLV
jgi:hypothetical protein